MLDVDRLLVPLLIVSLLIVSLLIVPLLVVPLLIVVSGLLLLLRLLLVVLLLLLRWVPTLLGVALVSGGGRGVGGTGVLGLLAGGTTIIIVSRHSVL